MTRVLYHDILCRRITSKMLTGDRGREKIVGSSLVRNQLDEMDATASHDSKPTEKLPVSFRR